MTRLPFSRPLTLALATSLTGCLPGLTLTQGQSAATKPGLVLIDFTLATNGGQPVPNLSPTQFSIYEDGTQVTSFEAKPSGVDAAAHAARYTLLYCTPARGGFHDVRVAAHSPDGLIGELTYRFNADGFAPGCGLNPPAEVVQPPEPPPPEKKTEPAREPPKKPRPHPAAPPTPEAPPPHAPEPSSDPFAP